MNSSKRTLERRPIRIILTVAMLTGGAAGTVPPIVARAQSTSRPSYVRQDEPITYGGLANPTVLWTTGDDYSEVIPLPFPFVFYGTPQSEVTIGTNGAIAFGPTRFIGYTNEEPGNSPVHNGFVAPFWEDLALNSGFSARIGYEVAGQAPDRTFTVEFKNVSILGNSSTQLNFMVRLFEGRSGRMEIDYGPVQGTWFGGAATMGMESIDGDRPIFFAASACRTDCGQADVTALVDRRIRLAFGSDGKDVTGGLVGWPTGAFPGSSVTGQLRLENLGTVTATSVVTELFLSADDRLDPSDVSLGATTQDLVAHAAIEVPMTVDIPTSVPVGTFRLLMQVDATELHVEPNEENNFVVGPPFSTAYEFAPRSATVVSPGAVNPRDRLQVSVAIASLGVPRTGPVRVQLHASTDATLGPEDISIGAANANLSGLALEEANLRFTVPSLPAGRYFLAVTLDPSNQLAELDETNNALVTSAVLRVGPDLMVREDMTLPEQAAPGDTGSVGIVLANDGATYSGTVAFSLYLSSDASFNPGDLPLGRFDAVFSGEPSLSVERPVLFPPGLTPGIYHIIAFVDDEARIDELDETNNAAASRSAFPIGLDLALRSGSIVTTPTTVDASDTVRVTANVVVRGGRFVGDADVGVYLSLDSTLDPADALAGTGVASFSGETEREVAVEFSVPGGLPPGTYAVFAVVDPAARILEVDESNNASIGTATIQVVGADLFVRKIEGPDIAFIGVPYSASTTIQNLGVGAARSFRYAYYLSDNDICRVTDRQIFVSDPEGLAPGAERTFIDSIPMPTFTSTQTQWLCLIADVMSEVVETSETNNIKSKTNPIAIVWPVPDLAGSIVGSATIAAAGEPLAIVRRLENAGVADATSFEYAYVLSTNPTIDLDDQVIGAFQASLGQGDDDYGTDLVTLPTDVGEGTYYLGLVLDTKDVVREVTKANNLVVGPPVNVFATDVAFIDGALPRGTTGVPYEAAVFASGGAKEATYQVVSGSLPDGLTLDGAIGLIRGTPTQDGLFEFSLEAHSGTGRATLSTSIRIVSPTVPLHVATEILPSGAVGRAYTTQLIAVGGVPPYTWKRLGLLPEGLEMSVEGRVSGTPAARTRQVVGVRVIDDLGETASANLVIQVTTADQPLQIVVELLPPGTIGVEYEASHPLEAKMGKTTCELCTWSIVSAPPPGLRLEIDGYLTGTPEKVGSFPFVVRAQDESGLFDTAELVLTVDGGTELAITTLELAKATVGIPYEAKVVAIRGQAPYAFDIVDALGSQPPPGLVFRDGQFTGTPEQPGLFAFTVRVVDRDLRTDLQPLSIEVSAAEASTTEATGCSCGVVVPAEHGPSSSPSSLRSTMSRRSTLSGWLLLGLLGLHLTRRKRLQGQAAKMAARASGSRSGLSSGSSSGLGSARSHVRLPRLPVLGALILSLVSLGRPLDARAQAPSRTPYVVRTTSVAYEPLASPTVLWTATDDASESVTLPFSFRFYDTDHTTLAVGSNGFVAFPGGQSASSPGNSSPGDPSTPNGFIAPFWDDLIVASGLIGYEVQGTSPGRTLTIEYRNVQRYGSSGTGAGRSSVDFQIRLFEGPSGRIEVDYGPIDAQQTSFDATMGMEDQAGARPIHFRAPPCNNSCRENDFVAMSGSRVSMTQDPGPDLVGGRIIHPGFVFLDSPTSVEVLVQNLHGAPMGPFAANVETFDARGEERPIVVGSTELSLAAFEERVVTISMILPASVGPGRVFLALVVDPDERIEEVDESNNRSVAETSVRVLMPGPDLAVRRVTSDARLLPPGEATVVVVSVDNLGGRPSGRAEGAVVLSTNPVITRQDLVLERFPIDLGPAGTRTTTLTVTIPSEILPGTYHLGAVADVDDTVAELDEGNNGRASAEPIHVHSTEISFVTEELPAAYLDVPYRARVQAVGSQGTFRFDLAAGALPDGLDLDTSSGLIFGKPTRSEIQNFVVRASASGLSAERRFSLRVIASHQPLTIVNRVLPRAIVGQEYLHDLIAVGTSETATLTWSALGLPPGLLIERARSPSKRQRGALLGTPGAEGTHAIEVRVSDGEATAVRHLTFTIDANASLLIVPNSLSTATLGREYVEQLAATGGLGAVAWHEAAESRLPKGLVLASDGRIHGIPTQVGVFQLVAIAEDEGSGPARAVDKNMFEVVVLEGNSAGDPSFEIATSELPTVVIGRPYEASIRAEGGTEPYEWTILEGRIPRGLLAIPNAVTGELEIKSAGNGPDEPATVNILVSVSDDRSRETTRAFVVRIIEGAPSNTEASESGKGCNCETASEPGSHGQRPRSSAPLWLLSALVIALVRGSGPARRRDKDPKPRWPSRAP